MKHYKSLFLDAEPTVGDDANYKVIVVVFTDLANPQFTLLLRNYGACRGAWRVIETD